MSNGDDGSKNRINQSINIEELILLQKKKRFPLIMQHSQEMNEGGRKK